MQHDPATAAGEETLGPDVDKFVNIIATVWPDVTVYPPGTRFRIRNRDRLGKSIPNNMRGRTGTVISVDGPVVLGDLRSWADVRDLAAVRLRDVASRIDLIIEMIHAVTFDDASGMPLKIPLPRQLSHTWMEPEGSRCSSITVG